MCSHRNLQWNLTRYVYLSIQKMFLIKRNNPNSEYIEMNPTGQNMSENPFLYPTFSSGLEFDNLYQSGSQFWQEIEWK